jgi:hypothetical protein
MRNRVVVSMGPPEKETGPLAKGPVNAEGLGHPTTSTADSSGGGRQGGADGRLGCFAAGLAAADLPVLALLPRSKRPRFKGSFRNATCDPLWVDRHWHYHRDDNIGVRPPLGMVVLDIDPRNGGRAAWARLLAEHAPMPQTWAARTGSGGRHYWFAVGEMDDIRAHLCGGVDVKHGGTGFVVAPPSVHPGGGVYEWLTPPLGDPATAPEWLLGLLRAPVYVPAPITATRATSGQFSLQCLLRRIETAAEGRRHDTVRGVFLDAARAGDLDAFTPALSAAALAAQRTPAEIDAIIRYARERATT